MPAETARVAQGRLRGVLCADGAVASFKGVPFARPPVGDLRWRPPVSPEPWDGTRTADTFAPHAIQPPVRDHLAGGSHDYGEQSEDCLYLNVWTAAAEPDEQRPVMVWLHHGAFRYGGPGVPIFDGEHLARAGAVVVTVTYRLGALGFLAHPELSAESAHGASSNYGLLDQIAALEWVQENIAGFGGDTGCVTVFGLSAGSASVNLLMASPLAPGLLHRAIGQSAALMGSTAASTGLADLVQDLDSAEQTGLAMARALGCASLEELRRRAPADLLSVSPLDLQAEPPRTPSAWTRGGLPVARGQLDASYPVVDGHVLPRTPYEIYEAGEQLDVPLLCGSAARDGSGLPSIGDVRAWIDEARAEYGPSADRFLALFPANDDDVRDVSASSRADRVFLWQVWTWARLHARTAGSPSFYYHWSYAPPVREEDPEFADKGRGAFHGVELTYVFRNLGVHDWPWSSADRELCEVVSAYWLNFARTGDPNSAGLPAWSPFDPDAPLTMHVADSLGMGPVPRREQFAFWDDWYRAMREAGRPAA